MQYLKVKNWERFQHYGGRSPAWIKLHLSIVDDYAFSALKDDEKAHIMLIWVLASRSNGKIPNDKSWVRVRIGARRRVNIARFVELGLLIPVELGETDASTMLAPCKHDARVNIEEKIREEKNKKVTPPPPQAGERSVSIPPELNSPPFLEAWGAWQRHLHQKRVKITPLAQERQLTKCAKLGINRAIAMIEHSIEGSYQGLYEPKGSTGKPAFNPNAGMDRTPKLRTCDHPELFESYAEYVAECRAFGQEPMALSATKFPGEGKELPF